MLRPAKLAEYFDEKPIHWFSDYGSLANWRHGIQWAGHIPATRLLPRRYWRVDAADAHITWRVLPANASFEPLRGEVPWPRDRYVELAVAAEVFDRFRCVPDGDMATALAADPTLVVARTIMVPPATLRHVLAPRAELPSIGMTEATVHPELRLDLEVAPGLGLVGCDDAAVGTARILTLFWTCRVQQTNDLRFVLRAVAADGADVANCDVANCRDTLRTSLWPEGFVIAETVALPRDPNVPLPQLELVRSSDGQRWPLSRSR